MTNCLLPSAFCNCIECRFEFDRPWQRYEPRNQQMIEMHEIGKKEPTRIAVGKQERIGDWMQTSTGRAFWPLDPRPSEIHIEDIAAALSKLCRYGGHCKQFYSVAEHCVLMARAAPDGHRLSALLHDASEAYLSDVIRPIKRHIPQYGVIEAALESAIATRFGLPYPLPAEVKRLDNGILADERDQVMRTPPQDWGLREPAIGVIIEFWAPDKAEFEFLAAFRRYGGHWHTLPKKR